MTSPGSGSASRSAFPGVTEDWQARAYCKGADLRLFFPGPGGSTHAAKRLCSRCVVRAACLEHALAEREDHGVRGGLDEDQRRDLGRRTHKRGGASHVPGSAPRRYPSQYAPATPGVTGLRSAPSGLPAAQQASTARTGKQPARTRANDQRYGAGR